MDKSSNKALPWISAILAGFAAGGVLVICLLKPWEESARRAQAELRAERVQEAAALRAAMSWCLLISGIFTAVRGHTNRLPK